MNKFKQCAYTLLLLATCFVASPFMVHEIWKSSALAEKPVASAPPEVKKNDGTQDVTDENGQPVTQPEGAAPAGTTAAGGQAPAAETATTPAQPDIFVESDLAYFDDALFIGDSRTVGLMEYGDFKSSDFFCTEGLATDKINQTEVNGKKFDEVIDAKQYGKVYIMLGINEVGNDHEYVLTSYRAIVEKLKVHQPDAVIYVQANLHVTSYAETKVITNAAIDDLNRGIASLADNKRVFYLDINELYDDEYGYFNQSYTHDGVHPEGMYYTQWCQWLCTKTVPKYIETTEAAE
ncbi:MAG: GDSL-type esterase/lipase family protein [Ruminococcus sp.]|nr:GDSL-type esterase/lipase family protein [Ruminococcus sp.]